MELTSKDLVIISHFRRNARRNLTDISRETRVPVSTLFTWLRKFESSVIRRHTSIVDFGRLGYNNLAKIMIKADAKSKRELGQYLSRQPQLNSVCKITNGYDYLAEGVFRNFADLECFVESLEENVKVRKREVYYVLEDLKREEFLSDTLTTDAAR